MRRSIRTGIVIAAAVLVASFVASGVGAQQTPPPPPLSGTPIIGTPFPTKHVKLSHAFHVMSSSQKKRVLKIVHKDKNVKRLITGRHYHIAAITLWVTKSAQTVGGVVTVRFTSPQTLTGTFFDLFYACNSTSTYRRITYKAKYANVTYMTLSVDLKHKRVAGITPLGYVVGKRVYKNPLAVPTVTPGASCHT